MSAIHPTEKWVNANRAILPTRLTHRFGLTCPIVLAPMDRVSGAALVNAVANAGGFGLLGGGYADEEWLRTEQSRIDPHVASHTGVGFITWTLSTAPHLLDVALDSSPGAVFLSFGDPAPYAGKIKANGANLICQVGNIIHASHALDVGADILVAQGTEGGGHGLGTRTTFTLVPEIADLIASRGDDALLLAAGGVADGRGLAAALALGADGAVIGTRYWATRQAAVPTRAKQVITRRTGDDTVRQHLYDLLREKDWPARYSGRVLRNAFLDQWSTDRDNLDVAVLRTQFRDAVAAEDYEIANVIVGEAIGLIHDVDDAGALTRTITTDAAHILQRI